MLESEAKRDWRRERKRKTWSLLDSVTKEDESNKLQTNLRR